MSTYTVVLFSEDDAVREQVRFALGRFPAKDVELIYLEASTGADAVTLIEDHYVDLAIFDGEAQPTGGAGLARQLKFELDDCPPVLVLIRRAVDEWIARWSLAEGTLLLPLDPLTTAGTVVDLLRAGAQNEVDEPAAHR
jgi:DNA-binding NarL/FixJ family response regulator